jgi:iduronate 2-sulfatase
LRFATFGTNGRSRVPNHVLHTGLESKKELLRLSTVSLLVSLAFAACTRSEPEPPPNILFIAVDDLNDWVGALDGHPDTKTPNIDRLAAQGTVFLNAHTQAPLCGPSRASLMTGLRPSTTGIYGQIEDDVLRDAHPLIDSTAFLPEYFGQRGYKTMGIGKLFHRHAPDSVFEESGGRVPGFGPKPDRHFHWNQEGTSTDWGPYPELDSEMPDHQSASWAIERLNQEHDRPFFLAVGFLRPHVPWYAPQKWFDIHPLDSLTLPPYLENDLDDIPDTGLQMATTPPMPTADWAIENGQWPAIVQGYLASVSFVDAQVGRVLAALEASPYADNTVVVLFSDHGYHIGEKNRFSKHTLWERSTRVPLIFAGRELPDGQSVTAPVELLDIYPTLLDLAGLEENRLNEGESLVALIEDPAAPWPHAAVTTYGRNNHGVAFEGYRYIRYEDGAEEFYDHSTDPNEWYNLAEEPDRRDEMDLFTRYLPSVNAPWSSVSDVDFYDYFRDQKLRSSRRD